MFFIVLDLRLTKVGVQRYSFFYVRMYGLSRIWIGFEIKVSLLIHYLFTLNYPFQFSIFYFQLKGASGQTKGGRTTCGDRRSAWRYVFVRAFGGCSNGRGIACRWVSLRRTGNAKGVREHTLTGLCERRAWAYSNRALQWGQSVPLPSLCRQ